MIEKQVEISIVVPVFGCVETLCSLFERVQSALEKVEPNWELLLINDGDGFKTWSAIVELANRDPRVVGVDLSRNFGQHNAITAGFEHVQGRHVIVMDCDLQDKPEEILKLIHVAKEGYEIVRARRVQRKDRMSKRIAAYLFRRLLSYLTGQYYDPAVSIFGCYHRDVVRAILSMGDAVRSFSPFVQWVGFRSISIDVEHARREVGESAYTFRKACGLALNAIVSFSDRPLRLIASVGLWLSFVSMLVAGVYLVGALQGRFAIQGWATIVISLWLLAGLIILMIGIVGVYLSRVFEQVKGRPLYIVRRIYQQES